MTALRGLIDRSAGISLPYDGDFRVDAGVLAEFPEGTKVISASRYGKLMMEGEYHSIGEFYKFAPDFEPKPHSWGRYAADEFEAYYFLHEYIEMEENKMPDPDQLCSKLARVHLESRSPTGQFGFPVTTCQNIYPQDVGWDDNWTKFYTKLVRHVMSLDFKTNGYWKELDILEQRVVSHVIPRLLDALVEGDRALKPSLIHGDLWEGNIGTSTKDGSIYVYDSAAFYGHNELDIADWRGDYKYIHDNVYVETYLRHFPPWRA